MIVTKVEANEAEYAKFVHAINKVIEKEEETKCNTPQQRSGSTDTSKDKNSNNDDTMGEDMDPLETLM